MESRNLEEDETPVPTAAWWESCKRAIIPEVLHVHWTWYFMLACSNHFMWRVGRVGGEMIYKHAWLAIILAHMSLKAWQSQIDLDCCQIRWQ